MCSISRQNADDNKMQLPKTSILIMLAQTPKPQPPNPKRINQWHFVPWCFVCGIQTGHRMCRDHLFIYKLTEPSMHSAKTYLYFVAKKAKRSIVKEAPNPKETYIIVFRPAASSIPVKKEQV